MAGLAVIATVDMTTGFTRGDDPGVATRAATLNLIVIHRVIEHGQPGDGTFSVAGLAIIAAGDMTSRLTGCHHPIVATYTATHYIVMIHRTGGDRQPGHWTRLVTRRTVVTTTDMIRGFTGGRHRIVAGKATSNNIGMVNRGDRHRCPQRWKLLVAAITGIGRSDMRRRFPTGIYAVMTANTVIDNAAVIHCGRRPLQHPMTGVTFFAGRDVQRMFAGGYHTIVATGADT